ncbi:MAG TPA: CopG family transcriptional regulator [Clostridiales bacterium UBA9856]|jgi:hypothetical protein|nr:CopG family transcriptional regulator [Clostridiales bacterium UBA9856]HOA42699.1 ribbon-helix-helix domain-containing protein [Bacillota bacterium]HPZ60049.1 ribbon-helix-helix domain-containing protein [Bacillota bacterium]
MKRTQIYLGESEKEMLIEMANRKGKPMAELIREAVSNYLLKEQAAKKTAKDPISEARGFLKDNEFSTKDYFEQKKHDKELEK